MTLYTISAILLFCACIVESFRKRKAITWVSLLKATAAAVVLALPTMLPLMIFLICVFDMDLRKERHAGDL